MNDHEEGPQRLLGKGKRAPVPLTKGNLISAVVQRCIECSDPPQDTDGNGSGSACTKPDGLGVSDINKRSTPNTTKGTKSCRDASNKEGQNKKARSNEDDLGGKESTQKIRAQRGRQTRETLSWT